MPDSILRHGGLPLIDTGKQRLSAQASDLRAKNLLQLLTNDANDLLIGQVPNTLRIAPREKASKQGPILGSPLRKFVVYKGRGEQALFFAAWNEKSESGGKRLPYLQVVCESHRDGRAILNRAEFRGEITAHIVQNVGCSRSRQRNNHGVEVLGLCAKSDEFGRGPAPRSLPGRAGVPNDFDHPFGFGLVVLVEERVHGDRGSRSRGLHG